jgi:hypothetical protein
MDCLDYRQSLVYLTITRFLIAVGPKAHENSYNIVSGAVCLDLAGISIFGNGASGLERCEICGGAENHTDMRLGITRQP